MQLAALTHAHHGQDVYVLGSGPTIGHVDPAFFHGKIVVATNRVAERLGLYDTTAVVYTHSHYHHQDTLPLAATYPHHLFIAPEGDQGHAGQPSSRPDNVIYYPHRPTRFDFNPDRDWPEPGGLLVGSTSLHGSMHLAAHLGAATIVLVGADCARLDGQANQPGYRSGDLVLNDTDVWLARWEQHLRAVKAALTRRYEIRVYSLLPFLNANLEGHTWHSTSRSTA